MTVRLLLLNTVTFTIDRQVSTMDRQCYDRAAMVRWAVNVMMGIKRNKIQIGTRLGICNSNGQISEHCIVTQPPERHHLPAQTTPTISCRIVYSIFIHQDNSGNIPSVRGLQHRFHHRCHPAKVSMVGLAHRWWDWHMSLPS